MQTQTRLVAEARYGHTIALLHDLLKWNQWEALSALFNLSFAEMLGPLPTDEAEEVIRKEFNGAHYNIFAETIRKFERAIEAGDVGKVDGPDKWLQFANAWNVGLPAQREALALLVADRQTTPKATQPGNTKPARGISSRKHRSNPVNSAIKRIMLEWQQRFGCEPDDYQVYERLCVEAESPECTWSLDVKDGTIYLRGTTRTITIKNIGNRIKTARSHLLLDVREEN